MISTHYPTVKKQCIKHKKFGNLYVIPYVRGRLVFAELVARALEEDKFDLVAVDLPFFMNEGGLWEKAIKLFPNVSSLLIRKEDSTFVSFPFVPNDAACISLAAVQVLKEWGRDIELKCIDDSHVIHYPKEFLKQPDINIRDDYFVFTEGLEEYYRDVYPQLESSWNQFTEDQRLIVDYRAGLVAERLESYLKSDRKTLFICEYRLWWFVNKMLDSSYPRTKHYFSHQWKDLHAVLVFEDPLDFWARGALDDVPKVVNKFYKELQKNSLKSFDKLNEIHEIIKSITQPASLSKCGHPSIRKILSFYHYLQHRINIAFRVTPLTVSHLFDSTYSCLGKKFAVELAKKVLEYPYPDSRNMRKYFVIKQNSVIDGSWNFHIPEVIDSDFYYTGSHNFSFDVFSNKAIWDRERINLIQKVYPSLTKEEEKLLKGYRSFQWEIKDDYKLHEIACCKVRDLFRKTNNQVRVQRSWGSIRDGIDWKATLSSKANGEDAVYIKIKTSCVKGRKDRINEFTPVTFIFSDNFKNHDSNSIHDGNVEHENFLLGFTKKTQICDRVETVFFTSSGMEEAYDGHIRKYRLSSITFLYTRSIMGHKRYEKIIKRPERFQCRTPPLYDSELMFSSLPEISIAWAIKYAENVVFVVAKERWKFSQELSEFAAKKKVKIVRVSIALFNQDIIERLKILHLISSPLKKHPDCDTIVKRFID